MTLDDEVEALRIQLDALESCTGNIGDWHRLDARAARLTIRAQQQLAVVQQQMIGLVRTEPPDPAWFAKQVQAHKMRELIDELRMIRLCADSRIFEHEAEQNQHGFTNWIDATGSSAR